VSEEEPELAMSEEEVIFYDGRGTKGLVIHVILKVTQANIFFITRNQ